VGDYFSIQDLKHYNELDHIATGRTYSHEEWQQLPALLRSPQAPQAAVRRAIFAMRKRRPHTLPKQQGPDGRGP
jgi:hypothetical protein